MSGEWEGIEVNDLHLMCCSLIMQQIFGRKVNILYYEYILSRKMAKDKNVARSFLDPAALCWSL